MARLKQMTEDPSETDSRVKQSAPPSSAYSPESTNCFSTGRHLPDDGVKEHDSKLRLRKPSVDLDATNSTTHAFVPEGERAPRSDDIKTHNTRARSKNTGKFNKSGTSTGGKGSVMGKPTKKKNIASGVRQSSSSFKSQAKPRQRANSQRIPKTSAESHKEYQVGRSNIRYLRLLQEDAERHKILFLKKFMWYLEHNTGSSTGAWILAVCLLLVFSVLLLGTINWVVTKADRVAMVSCQWSWLRPMCVFACAYSPWPGRYVFATTCSYRSARSNVTMVPELINDGEYDLPNMLRDAEIDCTLHEPFFLEIENKALRVSPEEEDTFMTNHSELCSVLGETSQALSHYYQHVEQFSDLILQPPNTADAGSQSWLGTITGSQSQPQEMNDKEVSSFISQWQDNYDSLVPLGLELATDLNEYLHDLRIFRSAASEVRAKTAGARQDVVNEWPFMRRVRHDLGLLRREPAGLQDYDYTLKALDPWLTAMVKKENLLALVWSNVTAIHEDLDVQVAARFSQDALSLFGEAARLSVPDWLTQIREKTGSEGYSNVGRDTMWASEPNRYQRTLDVILISLRQDT
ncbi:MAG: hypothetical protein Q9221_000218 [Calogaya cf. arnoldii]